MALRFITGVAMKRPEGARRWPHIMLVETTLGISWRVSFSGKYEVVTVCCGWPPLAGPGGNVFCQRCGKSLPEKLEKGYKQWLFIPLDAGGAHAIISLQLGLNPLEATLEEVDFLEELEAIAAQFRVVLKMWRTPPSTQETFEEASREIFTAVNNHASVAEAIAEAKRLVRKS